MEKLLVVGIDGISYTRLKKLIKNGKLPNIKNFFSDKTYQPLKSTILPTTPVAWTTSYTGKNPGKTGLYGFLKKTSDYAWEIVNSSYNKELTIWEILSMNNIKSIVIGMPISKCFHDKNIIFLPGKFSKNKMINVPPEIKKIYKLCPSNIWDYKEYKYYIDLRFSVAEYLLKNFENWNAFFLGFEHLEIAHHNLFDKAPQIIDKVYEFFDKRLGIFLSQIDSNIDFIFYSDHGHKLYKKSFNITSFLYKEKLLKINKKRKILYNGFLKKIKTIFKPLIPISFYSSIKYLKKNNMKSSDKLIETLYDQKNSKVYPYNNTSGNFIGIYINDISIKDKLIEKLKTLRYMNKKVIKQIYKKEDLYNGTYKDEIFDLILEADENFFIDPNIHNTFYKVISNTNISQHELLGFVAYNLPNQIKIESIKDIFSAILYKFNINFPDDIDKDCYICSKFKNISYHTYSNKEIATSKENDNIYKSLKQLGYI